MGKNPIPDIPDEPKIEELLSNISPRPSPRFYMKMKNAPWVKAPPVGRIKLFTSKIPSRIRILGMAAFLIIVVLISLSFFPSVRAVARQIFYSFISAPSNQIDIQVTLSNPGDLFHFSDPGNFPLSIQDVQEQSGLAVKEISRLPEELILVGARYDRSYNAVTILYQANHYKLFLSQRPIGNGEDVFSIGSSAQVDMVKIGNFQGEYVVGGWKAISTQPISTTATPGYQVSISAIWDSSLPQYTLRWQDDVSRYELRTLGEGNPSQQELITLANELK